MTQGETSINTKARNPKFEALRVILMLFIVIGHCIFHCIGKQGNYSFPLNSFMGGANFVVLYAANLVFSVAVNCFVMISGYFLINKYKHRWSSLLKLYTETLFYSSIITFVFYLFSDVSSKKLLLSFIPLYTNQYWFVTSYLGLMLLAPFISLLVKILSRNQYTLLLFLFFVIDFKFFLGHIFSNYDSLMHFSFLYLLAGYFRIYDIKIDKKYLMILIFLLWFFVLLLFVVYFMFKMHGGLKNTGYNGLLLLLSIPLFVFMIKTKWCGTKFAFILSKISPYCFGIYLIHDHPLVRNFIWNHLREYSISSIYILNALCMGIFVFVVCLIIDFIRSYIFEMIKVHAYIDRLSRLFPNI